MASAYTPPGDPTEVIGRRAVALLIDAALLVVIGLTVFALLRYRSYTGVDANICTRLSKTDAPPICLKLGSRAFLWHKGALKPSVLVVLFLGFLDGVVLQSLTGSTVGKYCTRLTVVNEKGTIVHPIRMFGRWVMLVIDLGFFFVGCIITGATHPHRRLGDFVFGTYVVSMSSVGRPTSDWLQGGVGAGASGNGMPTAGEPASWTVPPVPVAATAALVEPPIAPPAAPPVAPPRPVPAVEAVKTPPGTTPTPPGQWGAVARPAPLVRSPQWATPPPSDKPATPVVSTPGSTPWAAPPSTCDTEKPEEKTAEKSSDKSSGKTTDKPPEKTTDKPPEKSSGASGPSTDEDTEIEAEIGDDAEKATDAETKDDVETKTSAAEQTVVDKKDDDKKDDAEKSGAVEKKTDVANKSDAKPTPAASAKAADKAEPESEPEVELELEAELGDEDEPSSQWKPVESASARNRANSAAGPADDSWWDEALSSGDSENGSDQAKKKAD